MRSKKYVGKLKCVIELKETIGEKINLGLKCTVWLLTR